ncbi:MAG TPA: aspartate aminotransferase family protein [Thermoanaerobaculia bacterium]|nr:aspartate aminotransferase family protein [Thermoanaerobaculia bacterium]
MNPIRRERIAAFLASELRRFEAARPRSRALFEAARSHLLDGVPMNWMVRTPGAFPLFVAEARGAHFTDVDGHDYVDLCLGDTAAMTGHSPPALVAAVARRLERGLTFMLPTEDSVAVATELARRFGLPLWQLAISATDANRFALRLARHLTGRPKVLVFHYCYHGTVDESFATLEAGQVRPRSGNLGPPVDPALTTRVVEWNDVAALEEALAARDVAAVLAEPAMTNIGIVLPEPGYHRALRELTRATGTFLILDETHTLSAGPGGCTRTWGLEPDFLTLGKAIASGIPAAVYGFTAEIGERLAGSIRRDEADTGGIGGTLAGNALSLAAIRATLEQVLTEEAYPGMIARADRFRSGVAEAIREQGLPWVVQQLGCRAEYWFRSTLPRNGGEAAASVDAELDRALHLGALNRGILMTPFHNMALFCPATTDADVDRHTAAFREILQELAGP